MKNSFVSLISVFFASTALAQGNVGGGGYDVILPDDTVVLADRYYKSIDSAPTVGTRFELPIPLQEELRLGIEVMKKVSGYGINTEAKGISNWLFEEKSFEKNDLFGNDTEYRFVEQIPSECDLGKASYQAPQGAVLVPTGCTMGKVTFLVESLFKRKNIREQALTLFHERFRGQEWGQQLDAVTQLTRGIAVGLEILDREQKKIYKQTSTEEIRRLGSLAETIKKHDVLWVDWLGITTYLERKYVRVSHYSEYLSIHHTIRSFGGGLVLNSELPWGPSVHQSAYIGLLVTVNDSKFEENTVITSRKRIFVERSRLKTNSKITGIYTTRGRFTHMGPSLDSQKIQIRASKNSNLDGISIYSSNIKNVVLKIQKDAVGKNLLFIPSKSQGTLVIQFKENTKTQDQIFTEDLSQHWLRKSLRISSLPLSLPLLFASVIPFGLVREIVRGIPDNSASILADYLFMRPVFGVSRITLPLQSEISE
jgi:hypothetical protein